MAAITATQNFSTSTSSFRGSQSASQQTANAGTNGGNIFSYSDSALTQLPSVDFNFDDLRRQMAEFTTKFDAFIEKGRKRVLTERNDFRGRLGELNEAQHTTQTQINTLQASLSSHSHILSREVAEKNEMNAAIAGLEATSSTHRAHKEKLRQQIGATQRQIEAKLAAQREYARKMEAQSALNGPELNFWETYLGCRIEGGGQEDMVRVVFTFPSASKIGKDSSAAANSADDREAMFELQIPDSGSGGYNVVYCRPKLEDAQVEKVIKRLNETRDIATLLKGMRAMFGEVMRQEEQGMAVR